ncbi:hypothetical protein QAD02_003234 [Eretmocerus hayati]|uniref:Uncharacterized protein n=1 Tax=Eretmocerus hayati TaxID=131215 RepID=A0ACC2NLB7_9HYME|nr:hypothetical protein QAD02_003234 [Eretmocerus hayati]
MEGKWQYPWTAVLGGATGSGKSCFVQRLIKHIDTINDTQFARIILHFLEWQDGYKELGDSVEFHEGLLELSDYACDPRPKLLIVDDLMHESSSSDSLASLSTKGSHHRGLSIIYITQNIFHQGKGQRDISLNAHYMVIFRNLRDRSQIQHLARQLMPENPKFLQEAYWNATSGPYGYLLLYLKQSTPDNIRSRTNIFPENGYPRKYDNALYKVRISIRSSPFHRAYTGGWSMELFKIIRISQTRTLCVYFLSDSSGEEIDGFFYEQELSRVSKDLNRDVFGVERVLEARGKGRKKQYFVS